LVDSEAEIAALEGVYKGMDYWANKDTKDVILSALNGHLKNSLYEIVKNNLIDATDKEERHQKKQLSEMDYRGEALTLINRDNSITEIEAKNNPDKDGVKDIPTLFEVIPDPRDHSELTTGDTEVIDLANLGLDINTLTPLEKRVFRELLDAASQGYELSSKKGLSLIQYWGKDYGRNMKTLQRLKHKRKNT
jgi:hypothetical protein